MQKKGGGAGILDNAPWMVMFYANQRPVLLHQTVIIQKVLAHYYLEGLFYSDLT